MENNKPLCELCKDTGYIIYTKVIDDYPYQYACLCTCKSAEGKEYKGNDFYVATAQEAFKDKLKEQKK